MPSLLYEQSAQHKPTVDWSKDCYDAQDKVSFDQSKDSNSHKYDNLGKLQYF